MADEELIKKTPPHSKSAEQSVIGSMILDPETVITVAEILEAEDFYDKRYGLIFSAITGLEKEGKPIDIITIENRIKDEKEGKPIDIITIENRIKEMNQPLGAVETDVLKELVIAVPTSVNVAHHAEIVYKNSLLRKLIKVAEKISFNCYAGESNLEDILQLTEKEIFDLLQKRQVSDAADIKQIIISVIESIEAASRSGGTVTGIPTGFHDLDYKMAGLPNSDLILIGILILYLLLQDHLWERQLLH